MVAIKKCLRMCLWYILKGLTKIIHTLKERPNNFFFSFRKFVSLFLHPKLILFLRFLSTSHMKILYSTLSFENLFWNKIGNLIKTTIIFSFFFLQNLFLHIYTTIFRYIIWSTCFMVFEKDRSKR